MSAAIIARPRRLMRSHPNFIVLPRTVSHLRLGAGPPGSEAEPAQKPARKLTPP